MELVAPILLFILYFTPYFVASSRNHHAKTGIVIVNLLFGWTMLFWVVTLMWAYSNDMSKR